MKKILIAALAVSTFVSAAPALAQSTRWIRQQDELNDPAYQRAIHSGGSYDYGYNGPVVVQQQPGDSTCFLFIICSHHTPRAHPGDRCYGPNGVMFGLDRNLRWYRIEGAEPLSPNMRSGTATCDWTGTSVSAAAK